MRHLFEILVREGFPLFKKNPLLIFFEVIYGDIFSLTTSRIVSWLEMTLSL